MAPKPLPVDWDAVEALVEQGLSLAAVGRRLGLHESTMTTKVARDPALKARMQAARERASQAAASARVAAADAAHAAGEPSEFALQLRDLIRRKKRIRVDDLADQLDCSPKRVRETLEWLRLNGYRVPEQDGGVVSLEAVQPDQVNLHTLDPKLLDGDVLRVGVVSDTHLSSNEEALDELHLAYDHFAAEGIEEVWHAGDFTCGLGIFPGQASEIKTHTFEGQVDYLEREYPYRPGIRTLGISGNHDVEGQFGRVGANPVIALANRREDVEFLGDYSAWLEMPNGAWTHLLHGKGGMSYAYSYKAQKLVDGYPAGRKPAILIPGHWHVRGNISARNVEVLWPGCFEWRSKFLERLGLHPKVGFHILTVRLGDDGSLVRFLPEWLSFYQGRVVSGVQVHADRDDVAA